MSGLMPPFDPEVLSPLSPIAARPVLGYDVEGANKAWLEWGANCGPWALAAALGKDLDEVRPLLPAFARRRFVTEIDMRAALSAAGVSWDEPQTGWPSFGVVRVAWHGPWWDSPEPFARLRHSHWIAVWDGPDRRWIFDGNAIARGGWMDAQEWMDECVPWLLARHEPQATGAWRVVDRMSWVSRL